MAAMANSTYLTAAEAAEALGINRATLYSYVSRGLIRSEAGQKDRRDRLYHAEDVQQLKTRKAQRRNPAMVLEDALHWGTPILDSALTLIANGGFYYRGSDALELAQRASIEEVAALLWTGDAQNSEELFGSVTGQPSGLRAWDVPFPEATYAERLQMVLSIAAAHDGSGYDLRSPSVARTGARIMKMMTEALAGIEPAGVGIADALQQGWRPGDQGASGVISAVLVLCADHELNASTFCARCAASAGSSPYAAVIAGLSALMGMKHGRSTERVEALLDEVGDPFRARTVLENRLRRGERIPGFGHALYSEGDPRGKALLELTQKSYSGPAVDLTLGIVSAARDLIGELPNIDMGLVTLTRGLEFPRGSPLALYALGRTAGWIGHAIEQYEVNQLIRPRARYVGPSPQRPQEST